MYPSHLHIYTRFCVTDVLPPPFQRNWLCCFIACVLLWEMGAAEKNAFAKPNWTFNVSGAFSHQVEVVPSCSEVKVSSPMPSRARITRRLTSSIWMRIRRQQRSLLSSNKRTHRTACLEKTPREQRQMMHPRVCYDAVLLDYASLAYVVALIFVE